MLSVNQVLVISPEKEHLERIGDDISLSFTSGDCSSRKSEARTNAKDYLPRRFACLAALRCALASFFIDFRCFLTACFIAFRCCLAAFLDSICVRRPYSAPVIPC